MFIDVEVFECGWEGHSVRVSEWSVTVSEVSLRGALFGSFLGQVKSIKHAVGRVVGDFGSNSELI